MVVESQLKLWRQLTYREYNSTAKSPSLATAYYVIANNLQHFLTARTYLTDCKLLSRSSVNDSCFKLICVHVGLHSSWPAFTLGLRSHWPAFTLVYIHIGLHSRWVYVHNGMHLHWSAFTKACIYTNLHSNWPAFTLVYIFTLACIHVDLYSHWPIYVRYLALNWPSFSTTSKLC